MPRFHHLRKLFRILELYLILTSLSWVSTRLLFAIKIYGQYFSKLVTFVVSPLFIFLFSNIIVLTLLFKSGLLFPQYSHKRNETHMEFYEEFIINSDDSTQFIQECVSQAPEPEEIMYQDKQSIYEVRINIHRKSQSETCTKEESREGNCEKKLRPSETDKCRKVVNPGEVPAETVMVDELSNEEFQRAIEDFIAKQIKFHQEEKL
ncbi:unnamed protein product [Fraxinus pennsylvanica]|uniref:DUF4408 domain-containing protein n=1 Tax=Fraxinus pennsylvanica TaxID=56036 RepID=A0AAD1YPP4_9LAMI|nr:unnamed protein product [Fraxinus pennsylvanica]